MCEDKTVFIFLSLHKHIMTQGNFFLFLLEVKQEEARFYYWIQLMDQWNIRNDGNGWEFLFKKCAQLIYRISYLVNKAATIFLIGE